MAAGRELLWEEREKKSLSLESVGKGPARKARGNAAK